MTYLQKAKKIKEAGFWMAGYGHFDITIEEFALILELADKEDFEEIADIYEALQEQRL